MSTSKRPARPTDPLAWRDQLIAELEKTSKTVKGSLQQVLLKMLALLNSARPGGTLDKQLFHELQEAFGKFAQDPAGAQMPAVIMECLEWVHTCFMAPGAASAGGAAKKGGKDSFDSGAAQRARSLTGEAPAAAVAPPKKEQPAQQLESIKTWMLNPGLGKLKG
jgi:hypothetical protein